MNVLISEKLDLHGKELYLLGEDKRLHKSSLLLWNDQPSLKSRVKHVDGVFLENRLVKGRPQLTHTPVQILPGLHKPKYLSSVIRETLSEDVKPRNNSPAAEDFLQRLSSPQFHDGLCRLIATERESCFMKDIEVTKEKIQEIKVTTVLKLTTYLVYNGEAVQGSTARQQMFCEEKRETWE